MFKVGKACIQAKWLIRLELTPVSVLWRNLEHFYSLQDGMLGHCRITLSIKFSVIYTPWVERGTVRVKCFAQEHNTVSPARAQTRTTPFGVERINHEAPTPPAMQYLNKITFKFYQTQSNGRMYFTKLIKNQCKLSITLQLSSESTFARANHTLN